MSSLFLTILGFLLFSDLCFNYKFLNTKNSAQIQSKYTMHMFFCKADIRNPLSLFAHERSRFATCQWELLTPTDKAEIYRAFFSSFVYIFHMYD